MTIEEETIDGWIDNLDISKRVSNMGVTIHGMNQNILLTYFVQQQLPKVTLPTSSGKLEDWVPGGGGTCVSD